MTGPRIPPDVREQLQLRANHLKMLPAIAMQALDVAKDMSCGINEFAAVVERDATLASDILRMANSVMFGGGRSVMNLHQAVVRLGLRQCKSLIIASSFSSMMKKMSLDEEWVREILFRHSFVTALNCLYLNRSLKIGFQGEEFVAGLIHDVGRMLLATCCPDRFSTIDPMEFIEGPETLDFEEDAIHTNHCEVGMWFANKNSLPEPLIEVVRFHHTPAEAKKNGRLVSLIAVGDHMANYLQRFESPIDYDPSTNSAIELLQDHRGNPVSDQFLELAPSLMESAYRDASEMLSV